MNKELYLKTFETKDHLDDNIEDYIKRAFECGDTIYLYRTRKHSLGKNSKYGWIKEIEHEEYDKLIINADDKRYSGEYVPKGDKCIYAFDMKKPEIRNAIKENYRFPIVWAIGDLACKMHNDEFFSDEPEFDRYNVVVSKDGKVLLDGEVHEFIMLIDSRIVREVDRRVGDEER